MKKKFLFCLILVLVSVVLISCGNDKELTAKVDALSETVEALVEENKSLKASLSNLQAIEESLEFEAPAYPIKYELTEKSYEEFKDFLRETIKAEAKENNASDAELEAVLASLEAYDVSYLVSTAVGSYGEDVTCIELLNEYELSYMGYTGNYSIREGKLYIYDDEVGTINDDVISLINVEGDLAYKLNFYRTSPKSSEKLSLAEKLASMESKINAAYEYCFY